MPDINPNLLFSRNREDALFKLKNIEKFIEYTDSFFRQQMETYAVEGYSEQDPDVPLFADDLPSLLYNSAIIITVSLLEQELIGFCHSLRDPLELPANFNDTSGPVLDRFKRYAIKTAGIDIDLSGSEWKNIKDIYEVRNCLVHSAGDLTRFQRAQIVREFAKHNQCSVNVNNRIEFGLPSTLRITGIVGKFLNFIYDGALKKFPGDQRLT